ncbi:MAG: MerR family transcriptional regulator [Clostridia bacterium]|nr:MerR family transcriptional regulator [Clostridia bacterium]
MKIGDFSKKTQVSIDTLRYYDRLGLLVPKRINAQRIYNDTDLEKMQLIETLKSATFKIEEIKSIFEMEKRIESGNLKDLTPFKILFSEKLESVNQKIDQLKKAQCIMKSSLIKLNELDDETLKEIMEETCF